VLFTSAAGGVNVAVLPLKAADAATGEPPAGVSVKLLLVIVEASIALEKVAVGATPTGTPVALFAGVVAVTDGALLTVVKLQLNRPADRRAGADCTVVSSFAV